MLDFVKVCERINTKKSVTEIYPKFIVTHAKDIMIRGNDFYAIWDEEKKQWSTDAGIAIGLIDKELDKYVETRKTTPYENLNIYHLWDTDSGSIDKFNKFCKKQMYNTYHNLDEKIMFSNADIKREDYSSKRLSYPLEEGDISAYDELIGTLYDPVERQKIEWAIGAIVNGDSKKLQKFLVLYGAAGTGKSTILDIVEKLFEGYVTTFDAKALGNRNNAFALEPFKDNPLVAVQHDGDLSHIEDNTVLNSLISHEKLTVNEKYKSTYAQSFKTFLFMGTNSPVRITNAKSGLLRRLIDVRPSGNLIPLKRYNQLVKKIPFELGAIAYHCKKVYEENPDIYNNYVPVLMLGASNDFYNFIMDSYEILEASEGITLKQAWRMYKEYCEDAKVPYPYSMRAFKEELKNYYEEYAERASLSDGTRVRSYFKTFKMATTKKYADIKDNESGQKLELNQRKSLFDNVFSDAVAQYAVIDDNGKERPKYKWVNCRSRLKDLETWKTHFVKVPENLIVIDFDLKNDKGEKDLDKNLEAAGKWPPTYAELSKGGKGVHLHYYYEGDVTLLSNIYDEDIEIKVFKGDTGSALRRRVSLCNDIPIATLSSGLPLAERKGETMVTSDRIRSERGLRAMIESCLDKQHHGYTKPEMDFILKILTDAHENGLKYDVSDMRNDIINFALGSTNQSEYCLKLVDEMPFKSGEETETEENLETITDDYMEKPIIFFDCEVFPNLFLINWKEEGEGKKVFRMINPKPHEVIEFEEAGRLVGFNNRGYDNHMIHAAELGYNNRQLFELSQKLTSNDKEIQRRAKFGTAFNKSYTDIFDYAAKRQSLKKWEIELGIHHMELGLPWDEPVPEEKWIQVAEYCDNDVISTEAVWNATKADFKTRQILADLAGMTVNDTTNSLIERIVFGHNKHPQNEFNYRKMWEKPAGKYFTYKDAFNYAIGKTDKKPEGQVWFEDYKFWFEKKSGKMVAHSSYRDVDDVGEGGYVYSEPGIWYKIKTQDVSGQHPASLRAEKLLGPYTDTYGEIVDARLAIKHKDLDTAREMLDGKLAPYLDDPSEAKDMAKALKLVVNRVYGQTFTSYENPFKDPKNLDNIVAKRGSLFMIDLRNAVQSLGYRVVHCKTDSIKIPYITPELIKFIRRFGECYGYQFETEEEYERLCLVNKAVYIAKTEAGEWTATGAEFAHPYIYKTLFSHEDLEFNDLCETKSTDRGGAIYLDMNEGYPDTSDLDKEMKDIRSLRTAFEKVVRDTNGKVGDLFTDEKFGPKLKTFNKRYGTDFGVGRDMTELDDLYKEVEARELEGHNYIFVGKVGQFCPVKEGTGGGELVRKDAKGLYAAVTGTSGYRWLESEMVRNLGKEDDIDMSYFEILAEDAKKDISEFGDFETFANGDLPANPKLESNFIDGISMPYPVY